MFGALLANAQTDNTELKIQLQSNLQRAIDHMLIEGAFTRIDFSTGQPQTFYPVDTHAQILSLGDNFVMCSDLKRPDGTSVTVDYYMVKKDEAYELVQTEIANRSPLMALMEQGKAKLLQ